MRVVLGEDLMKKYSLLPIGSISAPKSGSNFTTYNSYVNPMISVEFATAAYRMVS